MESSKPLATESFSYSWLVDRKQMIRPTLSENEKEQNFKFDVSLASFHAALAHADEIFSDGHIMPVYADRARVGFEALKVPRSAPHSPHSSYAVRNPCDASKKESCLVRRWRRSSKRILQKCFGLMRFVRKSSRVDDIERKVCEAQSWSNSPSRLSCSLDWCDFKKIGNEAALRKARSPVASPRVSPARASSSWCGDESSILEAIIYCKRSIEK